MVGAGDPRSVDPFLTLRVRGVCFEVFDRRLPHWDLSVRYKGVDILPQLLPWTDHPTNSFVIYGLGSRVVLVHSYRLLLCKVR